MHLTLPPGEYQIGYAYPTSPMARRLRRWRTGGYYFQAAEQLLCFDTLATAMAHAASSTLQPHRWSMDHPLNRRWRPDAG